MTPLSGIAPDDIFAIVVGIEKYQGPMDLDGPAGDACKFADWLLKNNVPAKNISLYLSVLEENVSLLNHSELKVNPPTLSAITHEITTELKGRQESLLIFYWGGHGVVEKIRDRKLFCEDATLENRINLDFNSLLEALGSDYFTGFNNQIFLVDACADHFEKSGSRYTLPNQSFPAGDPIEGRDQFVIVASRPGEKARNLSQEKTGQFSKFVHEILEESTDFPPDMQGLWVGLKQKFTELYDEFGIYQTPNYLWYCNWDGNEQIRMRSVQQEMPKPVFLDKEKESLKTALKELPSPDAQQLIADRLAWVFENHRSLEILIEDIYALEAGTPQMEDVFATLDRVKPLLIEWKKLSELKKILAGENFARAEIAQEYYTRNRTEAEICRFCGNRDLLPCVIETLAGQVHDFQKAPLLEFLAALLPKIDRPEQRSAISEWMRPVAAEFDTTLKQLIQKAQPNGLSDSETGTPPYLMVKFENDKFDRDRYLIKGWIASDGEFKALTFDEQSFPPEKFCEILENLILEAKEYLYAKFNRFSSEIDNLIIEVFLPVEQLLLNIDEWEMQDGLLKKPIGYSSPVIVRSYERVYQTKKLSPASERWKEKWRNRPQPITPADIFSASRTSDFGKKLYYDLKDSGFVFMSLAEMPSGLKPKEKEIEILSLVIDSGAPVSLWLRKVDGDVEAIREELEHFIINTGSDRIPSAIQNKRRSLATGENSSGFWEKITLLWDDPDRIPPDVNFNFGIS